MTLADALRDYATQAGAKRAAMVRRFLEQEGWHPEPDAASKALERHLSRLTAQGLRPSSVDQVYRTVRAFYRWLGLRPPRIPGHRYDPHDASRPALDRSVIEAMVQAVRSGLVPQPLAGLVALSTTYGLRAGEMAAVRPEDVDLQGDRIYLRTLKGGQARWMWLPPEVAQWIPDPWPGPMPVRVVESAFGRVWDLSLDAPRPPRVSWHAVRRALHRDLAAAGVSQEARAKFGRWAAPRRDMAAWYSEPSHVVGAAGGICHPTLPGLRAEDVEAWDRHPYLVLWS